MLPIVAIIFALGSFKQCYGGLQYPAYVPLSITLIEDESRVGIEIAPAIAPCLPIPLHNAAVSYLPLFRFQVAQVIFLLVISSLFPLNFHHP